MIIDAATIQKLALRSDLPRLKGEGLYLFAQLESAEQRLAERSRSQRLADALAARIAYEETHAARPLPPALPRAYRRRELSPDWEELEFAFELSAPYERRNRAGQVLAVARHLRVCVRLFKGAFAYFAPDDLQPLETVDPSGFVGLTAGERDP